MRLKRITGGGLVALMGVTFAMAQDADKKRPTVHYELPTAGAAHSEARPRRVSSPPSQWYLDGEVSTSVQVNVDENGNNILGDAANEPSIAVDPLDPNIMVIGWRQFDSVNNAFRQSGFAYSHDGGATWTFPGSLWPGRFGSDPVLGADLLGNFYYTAIGDERPGVRLFRSFDGAVNWDGPLEIFPTFLDKQWLAIDQTAGIGAGNIYMTWTATDNFTRSTDGGLNWDVPVDSPLFDPVWGTLSVGPDGTLFMVDHSLTVAVSHDAQDPNIWPPTFPFAFRLNMRGHPAFGGRPNPGGLVGQPSIATDHSDGASRGMVYVLCSVVPAGDDPMDVRIARSTDGAQTWRRSFRVNDDADGTNAWQWFGTLSVAPSGRLDAVWYDTRNSGQANVSEVFYAWSTDRGRNWSENMQASPPFDSHVGWPQQNKLGDYIQMYSDEIGAGVAYAATFNGEQDVYFMRIAVDCNENGLHDGDDIASGRSRDKNGNGVPDECECDPCDMNCDGMIDALDIESFIGLLFEGEKPCGPCTGDVNGDGSIDALDIEPFLNCLFP